MKSVSVIVPVKNSHATIARTVDSLLAQDYHGPVEIILVGDRDDTSWEALRPDIDRGLVKTLGVQIDTGGRDSNFKRNAGLGAASGEILALTDSDMVLPSDWISTGVALLDTHACVGGPMASVSDGFWGSYVDKNPFASKTPRMPTAYVVNRQTLGCRNHKLPITANVFLTRELLERVGGLDVEFVHSYEDYEFFQRVLDAGYEILCTPTLAALHYHRQGWHALLKEYHRSGRGCGQFVRKHPHSPMSRSRIQGLTWLLAALTAITAQAIAHIATDVPALTALDTLTAGSITLTAAALSLTCLIRTRTLAALTYPLVTLILALSFSTGLIRHLQASRPLRNAAAPSAIPAVVPET
jgi:cellulose synthase/poly-beta-1,6-N-acetylglucosamine synthase-like glycosyltransferase